MLIDWSNNTYIEGLLKVCHPTVSFSSHESSFIYFYFSFLVFVSKSHKIYLVYCNWPITSVVSSIWLILSIGCILCVDMYWLKNPNGACSFPAMNHPYNHVTLWFIDWLHTLNLLQFCKCIQITFYGWHYSLVFILLCNYKAMNHVYKQ